MGRDFLLSTLSVETATLLFPSVLKLLDLESAPSVAINIVAANNGAAFRSDEYVTIVLFHVL